MEVNIQLLRIKLNISRIKTWKDCTIYDKTNRINGKLKIN